jgi:tetratricopeptide (TPR) repeat protein
MDLEQRLKQLEGLHDWSGVVEALEQGILSTEDATRKADYHLQLGRILYAQFLQGVRALKHFQDAYKLNSAHLDALSEARAIYWELGKLNMVQKLLELQLKNTQDPSVRTRLFGELGDVYFDLADYDRAAQTYAKAVESSNGAPSLLDAQLGDGEWQERIGGLLRSAHDAASGTDKALLLLRAARIARRFAPGEVEGILGRAYAADPANANVAALYEGLLVEAQRTDAILETQREALKSTSDTAARADLAYDFLTISARAGRCAIRTPNSAHSCSRSRCASIRRANPRSPI